MALVEVERRLNAKFSWPWSGFWQRVAGTYPVAAGKKKVQKVPRPGRRDIAQARRQRIVVVNRDANTVAVIRVRVPGMDTGLKVAEIPVGREPRCAALRPDDREAYVTNAESGTLSVIDLISLSVVAEIPVGTEPRGCAVTPNGTLILVALHPEGKLVAISRSGRTVVGTVPLGGNPTAIAVTSDGNETDADETVFVTNFFVESVRADPARGSTRPASIVSAFRLSPPVASRAFRWHRSATPASPPTGELLSPPQRGPIPPCREPVRLPGSTAAVANAAIPESQGAFPNQLWSALIRGNTLILPSIGRRRRRRC